MKERASKLGQRSWRAKWGCGHLNGALDGKGTSPVEQGEWPACRGCGGTSRVKWPERGGGRPWRAMRRLWAWFPWLWEVKWLGDYPATLHPGQWLRDDGRNSQETAFLGLSTRNGAAPSEQRLPVGLVSTGNFGGYTSQTDHVFLELFSMPWLHSIKNKSRSQQ